MPGTEDVVGSEPTEKITTQTWVAIGAMSLAVFAIANDFTAMNVVLPAIEEELDTNLATVQWVVNGYALVFGVLIVPGGRLADMFGRNKILYIGAATFATFSLLGGLAPNIYLLIAARGAMGIGAAMMWPAILGLIYALLPENKAGLAGGIVIGVAGLGNAAGPVLAGALAEISWRYIFFLNVPIALLAILVTSRAVHIASPTEHEQIDYLGTVLLAFSLISLLGALTIAPNSGWTNPLVIIGLVGSVVFMSGFMFRERIAGTAALVPANVMANRNFMWACLAVLAMSATFFATLLYLPQFFQKILGESTLTAGVMLLPFVAVFAVSSFSSTWLLNRIGMKAVLTIGAVCIFGGPLLFVLILDQDSVFISLIPGMVVLGVGVGLFYSSVTTAALTSLDPSKSSLAGGLVYMFQIAGGAVGLGITTAVFLVTANAEISVAAQEVGVTLTNSQITDLHGVLIGTETSQEVVAATSVPAADLTAIVRDSFVTGMRWAFALDAALAFVGVAIAATKVSGPLSRFGHDVEQDATEPAHSATNSQHVRRRHLHRHAP